jgi:patatin-like phospholipase/acyl hydrolase
MYAGTSVGAVLACGLGAKIPKEDLLAFFVDRGPKIFRGYWWRKYKPLTPRFGDRRLNKALKDCLPGYFGDVDKPVFVMTVDLNEQAPRVLFSGNPEHARMKLWEVARAAVAAETYFTPWNGLADGAIMANNPSMVAVAGASSKFSIAPQDLEIFSIGTGRVIESRSVGSTVGWSRVRWGMFIIDATLNGAADVMHDYFVWSLKPKKYARVEFERDKHHSLDNPKTVKWVLKNWAAEIDEAVKAYNEF